VKIRCHGKANRWPRQVFVHKPLFTVGLVMFAGCAATEAPPRDAHALDRAALDVANARAAELEAELAVRRSEIRRLESELALLRAEARRPSSVSITPDVSAWDEPLPEHDEGVSLASPEPTLPERRVTLKLYGERGEQDERATPENSRWSDAHGKPEAASSARYEPEQQGGHDPLSHYRDALAAIREQRLEAALAMLDHAIEMAPSVAHRIDAVYWRGEVLYLLGRHVEAEVEFASIVSTEVEHPRRPASLLRLGQCRRSRGLAAEAASIFERLRLEYPGSQAAAQLPREGVR
jgi:TolA-binding protein